MRVLSPRLLRAIPILLLLSGGGLSCRSSTGLEILKDTGVGCYEIEVDEWSGVPERALPGSVRLLANRGAAGFETGRRLIRSLSGASIPEYPATWWEQDGNALKLVFTTGLTGVLVTAHREGDEYAGVATAFSDAIPPNGHYVAPSASVVLHRTGCR